MTIELLLIALLLLAAGRVLRPWRVPVPATAPGSPRHPRDIAWRPLPRSPSSCLPWNVRRAPPRCRPLMPPASKPPTSGVPPAATSGTLSAAPPPPSHRAGPDSVLPFAVA